MLIYMPFNRTVANFYYDNAGRLTQQVLDVGMKTMYSYDNLDRLNGISSETGVWGKPITYQYNANGNRTQMTINGATTMTYQYDALNRATGQSQVLGQLMVNVMYGYEAAGRLQNQTINNVIAAGYFGR